MSVRRNLTRSTMQRAQGSRHIVRTSLYLVVSLTVLSPALMHPSPHKGSFNIFALESTSYTFASALSGDPAGKQALRQLLGHFDELDRKLQNQRKDTNSEHVWLCSTNFSNSTRWAGVRRKIARITSTPKFDRSTSRRHSMCFALYTPFTLGWHLLDPQSWGTTVCRGQGSSPGAFSSSIRQTSTDSASWCAL